MSRPAKPESETVVAATREWLEKAVIGLNLCPFAKPAHLRNQIRYCVSAAETEEQLLAELRSELRLLHSADPEVVETTLLMVPRMFADFPEFNPFLDSAEACLDELGLVGEIQLASFHPAYQFAGTEADDVTNFTNRSPFPTLHLLREASVEAALKSFPRPASIYEDNMAMMRRLGPEGWKRLWIKG
jgi:hypothetical protein